MPNLVAIIRKRDHRNPQVWNLDRNAEVGVIILPKTSGEGIQVDGSAPTYPWADLLSDIIIRGTGTAAPPYSQIGATGFYAYEFTGTGVQLKEGFGSYHIGHDYVPGTDIHWHIHWCPADANAGNVKWLVSMAYAKGHNQAAFNFASPITTSVTTAAPGTQYQHMISELVISQSGAGSLFDNSIFEPDGILKVRFYRDPADGADTYGSSVFVDFCDCHYQSTGIGTKNKAPNFYT